MDCNSINQKQLTGIIECFRKLMEYNRAQGKIYQFRAYQNAVLKLSKEYISKSIYEISKIEGFGKGMIGKIQEYIATGQMKKLETMKKNSKLTSLVELTSVYGIGPIFAKKLLNSGIMNISQLKKSDVHLTDAQKLGLEYYDDLQIRIPKKIAEKIVLKIKKILGFEIELMGGYRTGKIDGKDIDIIIITSESVSNIIEKLNKYIVAVIESGKQMATLFMRFPLCDHIIHLDLRVTSEKTKAFYTLYFGSGENFNRKVRKIAKEKGYTLSEHGLKKNGKYINDDFSTEEKILKFLNIPYIIPENRL